MFAIASIILTLPLAQHPTRTLPELQLAERSLMDYPRDLQIDAEDQEGRTHTLYRATPFAEFFAGFLRDRSYPSLRIDLPANDTVVLRLRDVATYDSWWSVHELRLWHRP